MKYWTYASSSSSNGNSWSSPSVHATSIDIETSAYALLAYTGRNLPLDGYHVLKWIITQRNSNGGFASSQVFVLNNFAHFSLKRPPNTTHRLIYCCLVYFHFYWLFCCGQILLWKDTKINKKNTHRTTLTTWKP